MYMRSINIDTANGHDEFDFIGNEFAIFDNLRDISQFRYPTRIEPAVIAICLEGQARISINLKEYNIIRSQLVVLMSEHIIQYHERSDNFKGLFIVVSPSFIDDVLNEVESMVTFFFYAIKHPCTTLSNDELEKLIEYYSLLKKRVKLADAPYRKEIAQNLLKVLFYEISGIFSCHKIEEIPNSRKQEYFSKFISLVTQYFKKERSISFYASQMCITPKYLSSIVKDVSGKNAGEWITEYVILEAKVLLKSSKMDVQGIAYKLNFPNQSFFGKYFKQKTGMTPGQYRMLK